jgi:hypothetical protein
LNEAELETQLVWKIWKKEKKFSAGNETKLLSYPVRSIVTRYVNIAMNISDQTLVFL